MKRSFAWMLALAPVAGLFMVAAQAAAQWAPSPYYPAAGYPVQQAYYSPYAMPPAGPAMAPQGYEGALAGYNAPMAIYDPSVMPAGLRACAACGGAGCERCAGPSSGLLQRCRGPGCQGCDSCGGGHLGLPHLGGGTPYGIGTNNGVGIWGKHGPAGCDGGNANCAGCCNPRWWDIQAEFLYWTREEVSRRIDFASAGVGGPIVLSTDDLAFHHEPGFRFMGALMVAPGDNLEGGYFGTFHWRSDSVVESAAPGNLYSAIGDFGQGPPLPDFPEVQMANLAAISYSSELHNWEMNYRRRWVSPNCRFHSSALIGARYIVLDEDFIYFIDRQDPPIPMIGPANTEYDISVFNDLIGFHVGGDLLLCIIPGIKFGGNIKAGLLGIQSVQRTRIDTVRPADTMLNQEFEEYAKDEDVAFIGEGGGEVIIEATERVTLRAGFQLLYINGVALAPEQFNPNFIPPPPTRPTEVNTNGDVFYHGLTAGFEYMW
jgi:hypothetical protein